MQPTGLGRIYRVVHETTRRDTHEPVRERSPPQLVEALSHPNGWRRDTAQRLLVERGATPVVAGAGEARRQREDPADAPACAVDARRARCHRPATVTKALEDGSRDVRVSGDSHRGTLARRRQWHPIQAAVLKRLDDPDWAVRQQLAASLGVLPPGARERAAVDVLERYGDDPVVMDAALSGLRGREAVVLERLLARSYR